MPKLFVHLRGTSGSGKTTVARTLMNNYPHETMFSKGKPAGVRIEVPGWNWPVFLLGKYDTVCGGMDTIPTQAECVERATKAYQHGHVLAEGLLASNVGPEATFSAGAIAAAGPNVRFLFLDTPLEVCIARVEERRRAKGNPKPLNPKATTEKWEGCRGGFRLLSEAGHPTYWLPYQTAYEKVFKMMARADAE